MERVTKLVDVCFIIINIMIFFNMLKVVYIEDVIERVIQYIKFYLQNIFYFQYDFVYRLDFYGGQFVFLY